MAGKIRQAAEDALPAIAARAGARPDWAQDFERQYGRRRQNRRRRRMSGAECSGARTDGVHGVIGGVWRRVSGGGGMARAFSSSSDRLRIAVCGCAASARTAIFGRPVWWAARTVRRASLRPRSANHHALGGALEVRRGMSGADGSGVMDGGPWR